MTPDSTHSTHRTYFTHMRADRRFTWHACYAYLPRSEGQHSQNTPPPTTKKGRHHPMPTDHEPQPVTAKVWRLILARACCDDHAENLVAAECNDDQWRQIADDLLQTVALLLADRSGAGIRFAERQTDLALYCEERDRLDLPLDPGIIDRQMAIWDAFEYERAAA